MDYTDLANVKSALGTALNTSDAVLAQYITRASRMIDDYLTGYNGADYLTFENVTGEILLGRHSNGRITTYPRKARVMAVTSFEYRVEPRQAWKAADVGGVFVLNNRVSCWADDGSLTPGQRLQLRLSYTGGLAASVAAMQANVVEQATTLAIRLYREDQAGVSDVIGVTELGIPQYTKAIPERVKAGLQPLVRVIPWAGIE